MQEAPGGPEVKHGGIGAGRRATGTQHQWLRIDFDSQLFYTYFHNHVRLLRLEKLLYIELSRSPNGFFKPLLDPYGRF
jgi:hypothetical protein